jgi:hypothetical protein
MWRAMTHFAGLGVRMLDLGLIDTERAAGLARFKLGAGARPLALGATSLNAPGTSLFARRAARRAGPFRRAAPP